MIGRLFLILFSNKLRYQQECGRCNSRYKKCNPHSYSRADDKLYGHLRGHKYEQCQSCSDSESTQNDRKVKYSPAIRQHGGQPSEGKANCESSHYIADR